MTTVSVIHNDTSPSGCHRCCRYGQLLFCATDRRLFTAITVHFTASPMLQPTTIAPTIASVTLPFPLMTASALFKSP